MTAWSVPRLWPGATVAILASGPGMSQAVADLVADLPCIAINSTYRLAPRAAMIYAHDERWWRHAANAQALQSSALRVGVEAAPGVLTLRDTGMIGFDPDPACVRTGGNSGYQAVHVAIHTGARRILLLGYDMRGGHWHGPHPQGLPDPGAGSFLRWAPRFATLLPAARARGCEIINCTPGSAIDAFPIMSLGAALARMQPDRASA